MGTFLLALLVSVVPPSASSLDVCFDLTFEHVEKSDSCREAMGAFVEYPWHGAAAREAMNVVDQLCAGPRAPKQQDDICAIGKTVVAARWSYAACTGSFSSQVCQEATAHALMRWAQNRGVFEEMEQGVFGEIPSIRQEVRNHTEFPISLRQIAESNRREGWRPWRQGTCG